jgi:nucleotide-binding universal stress UspA family protein
MTEAEAATTAGGGGPSPRERTFLVVVDESQEMRNALRYACGRAKRTGGRVALLYVTEPAEFQHWLGVGKVMEDERRAEAEQALQTLAAEVVEATGRMPALYLREGRPSEELLKLLDEEPNVSIVVLGTASGKSDPGPLVSYLIGQMGNRLRVPVTLVPGSLGEEDIAALA